MVVAAVVVVAVGAIAIAMGAAEAAVAVRAAVAAAVAAAVEAVAVDEAAVDEAAVELAEAAKVRDAPSRSTCVSKFNGLCHHSSTTGTSIRSSLVIPGGGNLRTVAPHSRSRATHAPAPESTRR